MKSTFWYCVKVTFAILLIMYLVMALTGAKPFMNQYQVEDVGETLCGDNITDTSHNIWAWKRGNWTQEVHSYRESVSWDKKSGKCMQWSRMMNIMLHACGYNTTVVWGNVSRANGTYIGYHAWVIDEWGESLEFRPWRFEIGRIDTVGMEYVK